MAYARGIDISRYNVSFNPDLATRPIDFVIQKATEGTSYIDLLYESHWSGVSKIGIRGAYHYQRSGMSWLAQANHFLSIARRHDYHILALDVEEVNNEYSNTFFSDTYRIINYLREQEPGKKIILYTNGNGYKLMYYALISLLGFSQADAWMDSVPLWFADPTTEGLPHIPTVRSTTWQIHQYSWTGLPSDWGTGGTRVDENIFNGDLNDMRVWLGLDEQPEPPQNGGTVYNLTVMASYLNGRDAPSGSINFPAGATLSTGFRGGDKLESPEYALDANGITKWYRITKCVRNNIEITIPSPVWASDGGSAGYLRLDSITTPEPPPSTTVSNISVTWSDNVVTEVKVDGTTWIKQ